MRKLRLSLGRKLLRRISGSIGGGGQSWIYLLHDSFKIPFGTGAVNGTTSTSGATRSVTDTTLQLSISGDALQFAGNGTYNDPVLHYPVTNKQAGLMLGFTLIQTDASAGVVFDIGYDDNNTSDLREHVFNCTSGILYARDGNRFSTTYSAAIGTFSPSTLYNFVIGILDTQVVWLAKGGSYTSWTMLHKAARASGVPSSLYAGANVYNRATAIREILIGTNPAWSDDTPINSLSNGDAIAGGASSALDAFFLV